MPLPTSSGLALKEWAVAVKALSKGKQILILRKGGIDISDKEFRVVHPKFLLYPTYEHQRQDLVTASNHADLQKSQPENGEPEKVKLQYWCEVTDRFEVSEQNTLDRISPYHIWTTDYANKRLHWRPKQPLTVALLRVYSMEKPQTLNVLDDYGGCKSWVELEQSVELGKLSPILSDEAYESQANLIRQVLATKEFIS